MDTGRQDDSGESHPNRIGSEETHAGTGQPLSSQSRVRYQQQHEFSSTDSHEGSTDEDTGSPPPHLSTTTTGTTTTPSSDNTESPPGQRSDRRSQAALAATIAPQFPSAHGEGHEESSQWEHANQAQHPTSSRPAASAQAGQTAGATGEESSFPFAIKMLVSNNMAGSIIGRSGQTISDLQAQSLTRIKLSQTGDYFPGTQDRVCLVQGQPENVKKAMSLLLSRLYALQQQHYLQHVSAQQQEHHHPGAPPEHMLGAQEGVHPSNVAFNFMVRILVPSPSCGMIIGKGGSNIKQMVDTSGVSSVRLSPKEGSDVNTDSSGTSAALAAATSERVVTINGPDMNSCITCIFIILDGMTLHPDICRYTNMTTSYSRVMSAAHAYDVAAASAARPVMPVVPSQESIARGMAPPALWEPGFPHQDQGLDLTGTFDAAPPISPSDYRRSLSGPPAMQTGFTPAPGSPHHFREGVPAYSPMFGGPATFVPTSPDAGAYQPSPVRMPITRTHSSTNLPFGGQPLVGMDTPPRPSPPPTSASAPDLLALQFQESLRMSDPHRLGVPMDAPPPFGPQQHGFTVQVAIPDSLIGSILGRGGRTLNELQMQSNTRIRISQRGEYVPGTKNRIVTIRGPTAQSVTMAQMMMSQRMVLPPTAVSPTTAFPIQDVERSSYEQQQQQQGPSYMPASGTTTAAAASHTATTAGQDDESQQQQQKQQDSSGASSHIHPSS